MNMMQNMVEGEEGGAEDIYIVHIMPTGWTIMGQLEVRKMNLMQNMVEGEEGGAEDIYIEHIYYTWDNHFSGDRTMNWLG